MEGVQPLIFVNGSWMKYEIQRVILDEGHNIRNPKTKMACAVVALNASRRWVLTGTPIVGQPHNTGPNDSFETSRSILLAYVWPKNGYFSCWQVSKKDLGSILTFLKICQPLDNEDFYKRLLLRPLKNGEVSGTELLRVIPNIW